MTRDKSSSVKKRMIVDLSWPIGNSVNNAVNSDKYEDIENLLALPTIDYVIKAVKKLGKNSYIA